MTTGQKIRMLREEQGISQVELAERIGESKQTLYKYETGIITNIPLEKAEAIAYILDVSPCYLMGWQNNRYKVTDIKSTSYQLSDDELQLVNGFRAASDERKEDMLEMARKALSKKDGQSLSPSRSEGIA